MNEPPLDPPIERATCAVCGVDFPGDPEKWECVDCREYVCREHRDYDRCPDCADTRDDERDAEEDDEE